MLENKSYDIYLNLRNKENLYMLKKFYENKKRSYQGENYSNYNNSSNSNSCHSEKLGDYNDNDKKILKKIYKTLANNFHPDKNNNSDESVRAMQIINELKNIWQI